MKRMNTSKTGVNTLPVLMILLFLMPVMYLKAQTECDITKLHGQGYSTTISSVTDNGNDSYTIVLTITNDGCSGPYCKAMNHYSIEADEGTYSNIIVINVEGEFSYGGINMGPQLGGDPFDGFRVSNITGIGNGQAGVFTITYTLTGGLQDQQTLVKAAGDDLIVSFTAEEFHYVLDCANQNIFPYYSPPDGGKNYDLIGAELTSLYETYMVTDSASSNDIFRIIESNVLIEIHVVGGQYDALLALLPTSTYEMADIVGDPENLLISGQYPIVNLLLLNDLPALIRFVRPVYPAILNAGIVTSQGDTSLRSYVARGAFQVNGNGIKVGVLSDSYNTRIGDPAAEDIIKGDLPGPGNSLYPTPVDVVKDYPYGTASDEGRAMLQIVHDIAPGAELAFRTGLISAADFAAGIRELHVAGCNIIVDDITYITEPFLKDGIVAQAVDAVSDSGVAYFSAAGNFGNKSYQSELYPSTPPPGISGTAHDFAAGESGSPDIYQSITLNEGTYTVVLQWDDGSDFSSTNTDLDIYLANENGSRLFGFNRINTGGAPVEVLPFTVTSDSAQTNILIVRASGTVEVFFKYIVFRGSIVFNEYNDEGSSTIIGQSNALGALAVGAVLYTNTPEYGVAQPTVASFSSRGGTPVNGITRQKPDISAPNGINTTVDLGGVNYEGDLFPNFFGTSAAAPHAAGVGALLSEAKNKYYDSALTPGEIRTILQTTSLDMYSPGYDSLSGYGFIQADAALLSLANPSPVITSLQYDTTLTPGQEPVPVYVTGQYLTDESQIYFNGLPLDSGTVVLNDTLITGTIPVFDDRYPPIQVYNPPNGLTNQTDGGLSNPLYFTTKKTIVTSINNKTKKYGEVLPEFTASYSVESIEGTSTLEEEGLSEEEILRITSVPLVTIADELSNEGIWEITASLDDPLNPASLLEPSDSLDLALLEMYNFDFERGFLSIERLNLVIIPRDTTIIYGDSIEEFAFDYIFNDEAISPGLTIEINPDDSLVILSLLQQSHATALVNGFGTVRATALVNDQGDPLLDSATLVNKSVVISNAILATRATALVNGTLIEPEAFLNAALDAPATALVNGFGTVRATALVNGTANILVNGIGTALVNTSALAFATALVNTTTVNEASNEGAIVLLDNSDISILSGDSTGSIILNSICLITGNDVGQHFIIPGSLLSRNFNISYGLGRITILPDTAIVLFDQQSLVQTYDGTPKYVTTSTDPSGLVLQITYDGDTSYPVNTGSYQVEATLNELNYVGNSTDTLTINPAQATVTADLQVIKAGDPEPEYTATFEGFVNGEDESVVVSLVFSLSPEYTGEAGTYQIVPQATSNNYSFTSVNGTLYVNPYGPGTKHIVPKLSCIEELNPDSLGFSYIAHFLYENDNSTDVYIPIGEDNYLSSEGTFFTNNQPELFLSGGGSFDVLFDGEKLTWTVASYKHNGQKTSVASNASSKSSKCKKSAPFGPDDLNNPEEADVFRIYPNPTTGYVHIDLGGLIVTRDNITVYDQFGKTCPFNLNQSADQLIKLDISSQKPGLYLIKISTGGAYEVFRIIKY